MVITTMEDRIKVCKKLLDLISKNTKQSLSLLRKGISNQPDEVIELFLSSSGCEQVFDVLTKTDQAANGLPTASNESSMFENKTASVDVKIEGLRAVKAIMRTAIGLEYIATCIETPKFFVRS